MDNFKPSFPVIEKGIPVPPKSTSYHPFGVLKKLKCNESVWFPDIVSGSRDYALICNRCAYLKRTKGFVCTLRSLTEGGQKGVRVWRIE